MKTYVLRALILALLVPTSFGETCPVEAGDTFFVGGRSVTVTKVDVLPFVESEYTRLFKFDSVKNPKLQELREHYGLSNVIAPGRNEFEKQVLLMDWVHNRFKKFGRPSISARGALEILKGIDGGETFFCTQYAQLLASAAASVGWVDRVLALRRHQDLPGTGSTEHSTTEIWSNQHRKWVMLDPTSNMYLEKNGVPLNAYEIRQEWFYNSGKKLVFVVNGQRYTKADLPIFLRQFPGFGDLKVDPRELDKYGFIGYIPNTDLMDSGFNYSDMFIIKDALCEGTQWHKRKLPELPETDPYFPIGQAAMELCPAGDKLMLKLKTLTQNFREFQVKFDEDSWRPSDATLEWRPPAGTNRVQARTVNSFGIFGPVSMVELLVAK